MVPFALITAGILGFAFSQSSEASMTEVNAQSIVDKVNSVDDGNHQVRNMHMKLIDKRGKVRERYTQSFRKYYGKEKRTILFYKTPTNVKGTAFLTFDYPNADVDDDQWLYLPALRKVRRISASDRGDYFLGTDFTYEDIKLEGKLEESDYHYRLIGEDTVDGRKVFHMEGTPKSKQIAKELGYGKTNFWVDQEYWIITKAEYWDVKDKHLKSLKVSDIRLVGGIITRHKMEMENHKTGHRSEFTFTDVDYSSDVKDSVFSKRAMKRGK